LQFFWGKIDHTVRDDHINRLIRYWQVFDLTQPPQQETLPLVSAMMP
jgi:hypothetical protein